MTRDTDGLDRFGLLKCELLIGGEVERLAGSLFTSFFCSSVSLEFEAHVRFRVVVRYQSYGEMYDEADHRFIQAIEKASWTSQALWLSRGVLRASSRLLQHAS